jgi:diguanylate cyclase (GGDEF)-like protein
MQKIVGAFLKRPGFNHWPLQLKLVLGIAAAQLLLSTVLLTAVVSSTDKALHGSVLSMAARLETHALAILTEPLIKQDLTQLRLRTDELTTGLAAKAVEVRGLNNQLLAINGDPTFFGRAIDIRHTDKIHWDRDHLVMVSIPMLIEGNQVGHVRVAIDLSGFAMGRQELVQQFCLFGIGTSLLAIVISAFLSGRLTKRVRRLTRASDRIIAGDYSAVVEDNLHDELGRLAHGINILSTTVNQRVSQLLASQSLQQVYLAESRAERARLHSLLDSMTIGIVFVDNQDQLVYVNRCATVIWPDGPPSLSNLEEDIPEREITLSDGRSIRESCRRVFDDNIKLGCVWIFDDITAQKKAQKTIRFLAERDEMTGLLNRRSLNDTLNNFICTEPDKTLALVYIDLDNFKFINDLSGHEHGDSLLRELATRLINMTRVSDVIARMGGDEFTVLIKDISQHDLAQWCDRLLSTQGLSELTCSIGVACYPRDSDTVSGLVAASYQAMLDAKQAGKNGWRQYEHKAELAKQHLDIILWSDRINQALRNNSFEVFLQGIHHTDDCSVHHYEALIRLPNQTTIGSDIKQYYSPADFKCFCKAFTTPTTAVCIITKH